MAERTPRICLELGTYCGYSSLRIANSLSQSHGNEARLVTVEKDPLFSAIALKILKYAGLDHMVTIVDGTSFTTVDRIDEALGGAHDRSKVVDLLLCDHSKDKFVHDIELLEGAGLVGQGTIIVGDTTAYPGEMDSEIAETDNQALLIYLTTQKEYCVQRHHSTEGFGGITVAEWVHLP